MTVVTMATIRMVAMMGGVRSEGAVAEYGAGWIGKSGIADGGVADTTGAASDARSGGETVGGDGAAGGVTGSIGGAGESGADEASSASSGAGGVVVGVTGDSVAGIGVDGDDDGDGDGVAGQDKGERTRRLSSLRSRRSPHSLRRFLVFLAGGGWIPGEDGGDGVAGEDTFPPAGATMTGEGGCAGASRAAVGVRPRCQQ
jgi:hypothetical protein